MPSAGAELWCPQARRGMPHMGLPAAAPSHRGWASPRSRRRSPARLALGRSDPSSRRSPFAPPRLARRAGATARAGRQHPPPAAAPPRPPPAQQRAAASPRGRGGRETAAPRRRPAPPRLPPSIAWYGPTGPRPAKRAAPHPQLPPPLAMVRSARYLYPQAGSRARRSCARSSPSVGSAPSTSSGAVRFCTRTRSFMAAAGPRGRLRPRAAPAGWP